MRKNSKVSWPWTLCQVEDGSGVVRVATRWIEERTSGGLVCHLPRSLVSGGDELDAKIAAKIAANARLIVQAPNMLMELRAAHTIIRNALALMTSEQKREWAAMNSFDGVDGEGTTRANERATAIAGALGEEG
jgi:hypothetical protein